jgi:predicted nuclease with TOPRIM domain
MYDYYSLPTFRWLQIRFVCNNIKDFDKNILIDLLKNICKIKRILIHVNNDIRVICLLEIDSWMNLFNDEVSNFIYTLETNKDIYLMHNDIAFIIKKESKNPSFETIQLNDDLINIKKNYKNLKCKYIQLMNKYNDMNEKYKDLNEKYKDLNEKYTSLDNNNEMNKSMLHGIITFLEYGI